jgi:glycosyltransferase involved in cell wall biosynthesis
MPHVSTTRPQDSPAAALGVPRPTAGSDPLNVGVIVDLFLEPEAGGHVKCWERFAEAAVREPALDLTIYFLGNKREVITLAPNVRYMTRRPLLDTNSLWFLDKMPDHTDLAPFHPRFVRHWRRLHVLHTTDAYFTLARTARRFARWHGRPLVNSIHTDTPRYTRVYSERALARLLGRWITSRANLHERMGAMMERKLVRYTSGCDWVWGSDQDEAQLARTALPLGRYSVLRRGIDKEAFHPARRDRERLKCRFGIPPDRLLLLFAGRLDPDKNVMTAARAVRMLLDRSTPVHMLFAGEGSQRKEIEALLGPDATLTGSVSQHELAWLYASSDLFVFPSPNEISPNVVIEAKASGLPIVVSAAGGSSRFVREHAEDGVILDSGDPARWAEEIELLCLDVERRNAMGARARLSIEGEWPSWSDVLRQDLLPVWQRVAQERGVWQNGFNLLSGKR